MPYLRAVFDLLRKRMHMLCVVILIVNILYDLIKNAANVEMFIY